ncbi:amino acid adenylation domain-containing protein, partial [Chitinophaga sp. YR573]|uniref:non-ribosomal peptide synthetase n=1 Tax=Chitinophaga sp. YR573 TaxID=1881040 RepID=UPI0008C39C8F
MTVAQFQLSGQQSLDLIRCCADQPAEITTVSVISGDYTMEILETAFAAVTDRHDILRTGFEYREGVKLPLQTVYQLQGRNNNCFRTETLSLASPLSIKILQLPDLSFQVIIKALPLILDAYSISLLYKELNTILTGQIFEISKEDLLQFSDYTNWETQLIEEDNKNAAEFWSGSWVADANVNSIWRVPAAETGYSDTKLILEDLPLEQYAASYNVSVKVLLTAIFAQSIARYNAEEPLQVACLENGRCYEELKSTMGPLSRYYPVRFPAGFTGSISEWTELSGSQLAQATDWNDYYYAPANPLLEHPQIRFVLEYCDVTGDPDMEIVSSFNGTFLCRILRKKNTWQIIFVYPSGMELATFLLDDLQNRLQNPELSGLHVGTKDRIAISEYNNTAMGFPGPDTVPRMILDCFKQYAGHIAVKGSQRSITYQTLEEKVKGIAFILSTVYGVGNGDIIGVMLNNDDDVAAVLLGILFSGAAYVPLDSSNPLQRLEHIVKDSGCRIIITDDSIPAEMMGSEMADLFVTVEELNIRATGYTSFPPLKTPAPEDTAYLIFTSGTTGKPKGCQISHANLNNYISWANDYYFRNCNGNFPLLTSLAFDLTVTAIFTTLTRGQTLYCLDKHLDITEKLRYCFDPSNEIDCIKLTPTHISLLADAGLQNANIVCAIVGGEELHPSQVDILRRLSPSIRIYNEYGPTEATVGCIVKEISPGDERITIGRPIANMGVSVLDAAGNILPVGVYGELYLSGSSVARGYWQQPVITAQRFVTLTNQAAERYYRTGDIVRLLPGGDMEFGGRIDDQIKIRGNRIEMGEIKTHLSQFPGVEEVFVVARKDAKEEKHITAYYIAPQNITSQDWKSFLQSRVPAYMIPDFFIAITKIPATVNGKLDVERLPDPFSMKHNSGKVYVSPVTPAEISISQLWQEILQVEKVGLDDNFYEMGGHSLLAMRVVSAIRREWKADIIIKDLLTGPTVRELAALVDRLEKNMVLPQVVLVNERPEKIPLSYAQERLWFIDQLRGSTHYHMPALFRLKGQLDVSLLETAFRMIVDRHESLRTVFKVEDGVPYQEILSAGGWRLNIVDNIPDDLHTAITAEIDRPFDLSADHMLRARLFRLQEDEHLLVLVRHHIASDGWSESLIVQEFCEIYQNREVALPVLPLQYADYALWQRSHLTGELLDQQLGYWEEKLKGVTPLQLPSDLPRPVVQSIQGDRLNFKVGKELSKRLEQLAQQEDVTPFMLLLAVYKVLLYRYGNQTDICVGTTVAHRPQQELEPLIGFFVNTLALRSDLSDNPDFRSLLSQVRTTTLEAYEHIAVPFEKVVDRVEKERDKSRSSLFQVLFVLNNNDSALVQDLGDITVAPESLDHKIAKFDLTFFVEETAEGFGISINYCTDLFLPATIERLKDHYLQLLSSVADDQSQPVGHLQMLLPEEEAALLSEGVNHGFVSEETETVTSLFTRQVVSSPERVALISGETQLSYQELDNSSTWLAHYLKQTYDLRANDLVGVMMENSSWSVIAILGILKAGAAYVPIDPSLPADRQDYIINDTGIKVLLITSERLFDVLSFNVPVFSVDLQLEELTIPPVLTEVSSTDLAYVIYTSGTTGHPKGVMITHGNITDYYKGLS